MEEDNPLEKDFETVQDMGWAELDELAENAKEIFEILIGEQIKQRVTQMIIAIRNRNLDILKRLAYESEAWPFRENIQDALKLLITPA